MKFSDVPDGSFFVIINPEKAMPIIYKNEGKLKLEVGFLQCHKQIDSSSLNIAPDTEVQLVEV